MPVEVSVPLGVGDVPHQQTRLAVAPGSVLALYTDGLVETPQSDIELQIDALAAALEKAVAGSDVLETAADNVLGALLPGPEDYGDDVTLLLVRVPPTAVTAVSATLPAEPASVGAGRQFLRGTLREWDIPELSDTACLLASELLSNAVRHATGPLRLRLRQAGNEVSVEVSDGSPNLPRARQVAPDDESGRGLMLVEALAKAWGTAPRDVGKAVWFSLPLPSRREP